MSGAECREDPVADISLAAPRRFFPSWGKSSIRRQLLLQVAAITLVAFSVSFFAVWELYQIRALFQEVRASLRPARSALQLAQELERIYGLAEAYQLSFNQPEQRQAIFAEIEDAKTRLTADQKHVLGYSGAEFSKGIASFLGSVEDSRKTSDQFTKVFEARKELSFRESKVAAEATSRFRQRAKNETTLSRYKTLVQVAEQLQNMHNALARILGQQQFEIPKEFMDAVKAQLEQVAADEQKKIDVLTRARRDLITKYRQQLDVTFEEFNSARDALQTVLAGGAELSEEETADLRRVLAEFGALFGDPRAEPQPATFTGSALLRSEMFTGFRLNVIALRALVTQLSKSVDDIVDRTQAEITKAGDGADRALIKAFSASVSGLLASIGLAIGFVVFVFDRNLVRRLNGLTQGMFALARGEAIRVTGTERQDELGEMARALQVFWEAELERRELQHKLELANRELQHEVDESINVAQRIQSGLLLDALPAGPGLADHALLSKPCRLLGGDCYWLERFDDGYVVALIDCTGHGVPGAMMTIVTSIYLNAILHEEGHRDPAAILLRLAEQVQNSLARQTEDTSFDAGFDAAICIVDLQAQRLRYAGGGIPLLVLDGNSGDVQTIRGAGPGIDRSTIGAGPRPVTREVELRPGLRFYLTSDGLVTQPDSPFGVGFGWSRLTKILRETRRLSIGEQNQRIWASFREFSVNTEQRDDVTLVGFAV
jgi:serine phosphatase RsbU (regulator of sigma subunit)